jgi:hypothetical protein
MNLFVVATSQLLRQYGATVTFKSSTTGTYDVNTSTVVQSFTDTSVLAYKKHIQATQYNYPNMIGKELAEFYVANVSFTGAKPKVNDKIVENGNTYTINKVSEHGANGQVILYCLLGVKS